MIDNMKDAKSSPLFPYIIRDDGIYEVVKDKSGKKVTKKLCQRIVVSSVEQNIDTRVIKLDLKFTFHDMTQEIKLERSMFNKRNLSTLMNYGIDITDKNSDDIFKYLSKQQQKAPLTYVHDTLGFGSYNGKLIYKLQNAIGLNSEYVGNYDVKPSGSFEDWNSMINTEVIGNVPLELALSLGFSAPIVALLKSKTCISNLFVHLASDSSKGKTTAEMLAVSPFGSPDVSNGLVRNYMATQNALMACLNNIYGVPIAIDESSIRSKEDFTTFIYQMDIGQEKGRLDKESNLKKAASWSTTVISSGEHSLLNHSERNTGLLVRLIELSNIQFTSSAENSERIKQCVFHNYGQAGFRFVQSILSFGADHLFEVYNREKDTILSDFKDSNNITIRYLEKIAIIMTAASLVKDIFGYNFDIKGIEEILLNAARESLEKKDIGEMAFESIKEWVYSNSNHFKSTRNNVKNCEVWGKIVNNDDSIEVSIVPKYFNRMLSEYHFSDARIICNRLKAAGYLMAEQCHNTIKRKVSSMGTSIRCYVIKIPKSDIPNPNSNGTSTTCDEDDGMIDF